MYRQLCAVGLLVVLACGLGWAQTVETMTLNQLKVEQERLEKKVRRAEDDVAYWSAEVRARPESLVAPTGLRGAETALEVYTGELEEVKRQIKRLEEAKPGQTPARPRTPPHRDDLGKREALESQIRALEATEESVRRDIRNLEELLREVTEPKIDPYTDKPRQPMQTSIVLYNQSLREAKALLGQTQAEKRRLQSELSRLGGR